MMMMMMMILMLINLRNKFVPISKLKMIFFTCTEKGLVLKMWTITRPFCGNLHISDQSFGQPLIFSLVRQLQHKKQNALFSRQNLCPLWVLSGLKLPRAEINFIAYLSNVMQKGLFKNGSTFCRKTYIYIINVCIACN